VAAKRIHRGTWFVAVLATLAVLLAACGSDDKKTDASANTTAEPSSSTTAAGTATPVSTNSTPAGDILVDSLGRTLYVFDPDANGTIKCVAGCADAWPPVLLASGTALSKTGPLAGDLGTVTRPEGTAQVTYKSRPLYRFSGDTKPGDTKGDGVANQWHLVKVSGGSSATGEPGTSTTTAQKPVTPY
jgi:predicted lipoprotein with Yx(FWY)xxD motif